MTREEIEKNRQYQLTGAAIDYCRKEHPHYDGEALVEITDAFEAGAEWEHKRLVEKACEWLRGNMSRYVSRDDPDKFPYGFPTRAFRVDVNFECDFKKAMEE